MVPLWQRFLKASGSGAKTCAGFYTLSTRLVNPESAIQEKGLSDLLLIPILDVEEEKSAGHDHSQDGKGGEDAVERQGDLTKLLQDDGFVLWRLRP